MNRLVTILLALLMVTTALAGCLGEGDPLRSGSADARGSQEAPPSETRDTEEASNEQRPTGPPPPPGEDYTGVEPVDLIFDGSLRHPLTRVLLVPPTHGDPTTPTNDSRSAMAYLEATIEGIHAWERAIDLFVEEYPAYDYLDEIDVQIDVFDGETPATAGYDIVIGYAETSGPAFRGVAFTGIVDVQEPVNDAGLGELVHYGNRYILLSLFASAPRSGQQFPDYPETHEVRGVTMHEFAHTWGLGHSTTWTPEYGPDLMNSPYPYVYGDGDPTGDGTERSPTLCPTTLDIYGLAHLYRWMPTGTWEASHGNVSLPDDIPFKPYCEVFEEDAEDSDGTWEVQGLERFVLE